MDNENVSCGLPSSSSVKFEQKRCWVCLGTKNDEWSGDWISPCKCRDPALWVHQTCVQQWINEKFSEQRNIKICCPKCNTEYKIVCDEVNYFVRCLNHIDEAANWLYLFLLSGAVVCTLYWCAVSYGAITMMQVMGAQEAKTMMKNINPFVLIIMLPTIPLSLIAGKINNWEEKLLLLVLQFSSRLPLLRTIMPKFLWEPVDISTSSARLNTAIKLTNNFCAALILPTTAIIVGNLLFDKRSFSNFQRTLFVGGGLVYIAVKGTLRIYQRQHNAIQKRAKEILNYPDSDNDESHE